MHLTKRALLAILSIELLLYSFLYIPTFILVMLAIGIAEPTDPVQRLEIAAVVFGPPLLWLAMNGLIVRALVRNARRDERTRGTMRFGLTLMGAQAAIASMACIGVTLFSTVFSGTLAIGGLVAAALMERENA